MAVAVTKCTSAECRHIAKQAYATYPLLTDEKELKARARIFQALGNETRLKILGMLAVKELCTCDIVETLGSAATTVAFHLRMLEEAGLLSSRQVGKFTLYQLNRALLAKYRVFE